MQIMIEFETIGVLNGAPPISKIDRSFKMDRISFGYLTVLDLCRSICYSFFLFVFYFC